MDQLIQQFQHYIQQEKLFSRQDRLLVGVSGGIDSVVLCHLLKVSGYDFEIAHVNFQLRNEESTRDEDFTRSLSRTLSLPFHVTRFDTGNYAATEKLSIQVAARALRYKWFDELMEASRDSPNPIRYILTAHHSNDNAETVLMNVFRGTGIAGLRGILPSRNRIRRPLLFADRTALLEYAQEQGIQWVDDSSNESIKYARNYIRQSVIPAIEMQYPSLISNLNESARRFISTNEFYDAAMATQLKKLVIQKGAEQLVPILKWQRLPGASAILFAWLNPFGYSPGQMKEAMQLADSQSGHFIDSATHRLLRNRQWLIITPKETNLSAVILIEQPSGTVAFKDGMLHWETIGYENQPIPDEKETAWLNADNIVYPLLLRPWKAGDYFYPLGMNKKKKLARFLIDSRVGRNEKEKLWVLEADKKILWVVGHRIDDRFKIKPSTQSVLSIRVNTLP